MPQFQVIAPPRWMAGVAQDRDTAYAPGGLVVCMYNALYAELRAHGRVATPDAVFQAAYLATVAGWNVDRAFVHLQSMERVTA